MQKPVANNPRIRNPLGRHRGRRRQHHPLRLIHPSQAVRRSPEPPDFSAACSAVTAAPTTRVSASS